MRKNNLRLLAALGLSLNLSLAGAAPAWAAVLPAGPGSEAVEVPENLKDNILEYEELPDLIGYYNVDVVNTEAQLTNSENLDVADELRAEAGALQMRRRHLRKRACGTEQTATSTISTRRM